MYSHDEKLTNSRSSSNKFLNLPTIVHINVEEENFKMIDSEDEREHSESNSFYDQHSADESDQGSFKYSHLDVINILKRDRSLSEMTQLSGNLAKSTSNLSKLSEMVLEKENEETVKLMRCWKKLLIVILCFTGFVILLSVAFFMFN
uniref:V-SNARE coiled-coil homology domain-containing protein n=1 Tax=Panagrolaimus davidi TaxID=227884 RepID=A0A914QF23_9BILA